MTVRVEGRADFSESRPITGLSLRRNFSWTFVGNVVYAACQWGMMLVLVKLGSPEKVGRFALGFAVTAPVMMFANLHLRAVLATDAKRTHPFGDYLALRSVTSVVSLLVTLGIVLASRYASETALVIMAIGAARVFESFSDIYFGLLQQHERMDRMAKSGMMSGIASLAVTAAAFYFTRSVVWVAVSLMAVWGLVLVFYDARGTHLVAKIMQSGDDLVHPDAIREQLRPRWKLRPLGSLAWTALPLGVVMLLVSLNTNIPRYFLERYLGEGELGIFAAIAYLMAAGSMVISALAQSAVPRLAKYHAAGDARAFSRLLMKLVAVGASVGIAGVVVVVLGGRWLLNLLYGPEYAAHYKVFVWVSVASALFFVQWFLGNGMTAARYFRIQPPLLGLVTLVTALTCHRLIPVHGLMGAAYALLAANATLVVGIACVDVYAISRLRRAGNAV